MLDLIKLALRITTTTFDSEINMLIADCIAEMTALGVVIPYTDDQNPQITDAQIQSAVVAYCKWKFGDAENKDAFERIYHIKLAQLLIMYSAGYVSTGVDNG